MSLLDDLCDDSVWDEFLEKEEKSVPNLNETLPTCAMIRERKYRPTVEAIRNGTYVFSDPIKYEIPKPNSDKKRVIYTFKRNGNIVEHTVLRVLSMLFRKYSHVFAPNLYTVTNAEGVKGAIDDMCSLKNLEKKFCYKADISDYFNSINVENMISILDKTFGEEDKDATNLISAILRNENIILHAKENGKFRVEKITENQKGVMAGMPFAPFLSGLYLNEMDHYFFDKKIPFFRYADDIMVVSETEEEMKSHIGTIHDFMEKYGLSINPSKENLYRPGEEFVFLGILFKNGKTMISPESVAKQKKKMKSLAKRYRKDYERGRRTLDEAFAMMIRAHNDYFFGNSKNPFSFCALYFPRINSSENLNVIDEYSQECIRYVRVGKFKKSNKGKVPYELLRETGYVPLVSAYRIFRTERFGRKIIETKEEI